MPGVTSLSVLFLLLALCPLDVAGLPKDMQMVYIRGEGNIVSVMDLATEKVTDLFTTDQPVSALDYDPVNQKVYWCGQDMQCYIQDYNGSNQTVQFSTKSVVSDMQVDKNSTWYLLNRGGYIWVKREGQPIVEEKSDVQALTVDKTEGRLIYADIFSKIRDFDETLSMQVKDIVTSVSWNPSDSLLYFAAFIAEEDGMEIRCIDLDTQEQKTILKGFKSIAYISAYRDVIVFEGLRSGDVLQLYAVLTSGTNLTSLGEISSAGFVRPFLFEPNSLPGPVPDLGPIFTWTPEIGCLQTSAGTSIKVTLTPGLEDFSLLVMDPQNGCSHDLGQFRQDITIPDSCVVDQKVEVAIQLTEIKDILGGRFFRHFLFSCSNLGPDGKAVDLIADSNPSKTQATASNTSYADGSFSLMVVTSANLNSGAELTSATNIIWSQNGVFLVLRHRLATGSQHRTLIPAECTINSTSHPEKKAIWVSKPDMECKLEMGLIDAWTIQSKRTVDDDVTYSQLFPFDFQVGEEVTITCDTRECPYVADAGQLQGKCLEAFKKYESCGGTFRGSSPNRRREVTSLSGNGSVPLDQAASRVMSASFTLG